MTHQTAGSEDMCTGNVCNCVDEVHTNISVTGLARPKSDLKGVCGSGAQRAAALRKCLRVQALTAQNDLARSAMAQHVQLGQRGVVHELLNDGQGLILRGDRYGVYARVQPLQQRVDLFNAGVVNECLCHGNRLCMWAVARCIHRFVPRYFP